MPGNKPGGFKPSFENIKHAVTPVLKTEATQIKKDLAWSFFGTEDKPKDKNQEKNDKSLSPEDHLKKAQSEEQKKRNIQMFFAQLKQDYEEYHQKKRQLEAQKKQEEMAETQEKKQEEVQKKQKQNVAVQQAQRHTELGRNRG